MDPETLARLRPHQPELVAQLMRALRQDGSAVDLSVTGAGKTYTNAAVAHLLRLPTLVVCPLAARSAWTRAGKHFEDSFSIVNYEMLRTGRTDYGKWERGDAKPVVYFKCQCCQQTVDVSAPVPCYAHPIGIHCIETRKRSANYGQFNFHPAIRNLIFDEVHRCGALDSLNADLLIAAKRQRILTTGLSATPACSPLGMRALGYLLDLHNLDEDLLRPVKLAGKVAGHTIARPSFLRWAKKYGVVYDQRFHGLKWMVGAERQREIMLEIRSQILPVRGVRVTEDDIPGFPERDIQAELYTLEDPAKMDAVYAEMLGALEELKTRTALDKAPDHPLTKMLRARQQIELLKVPIFKELGDDYRAKGMSVVFFVNFRQTIDELFKRFPNARIIDGQTDGRDEAVDLFQENRVRELIVNCDAGGICLSLHDLVGGFPRVGLVSPGLSATVMRQVFGRLHRDGGKSRCHYRVIFVDGTVEVKQHRILRNKLDNLDALTDADLAPDNLLL